MSDRAYKLGLESLSDSYLIVIHTRAGTMVPSYLISGLVRKIQVNFNGMKGILTYSHAWAGSIEDYHNFS